jgi:pyruvate formate lyase activating enzyme
MRISGLQKLTLIDYPKTIACTIFLGGCNFRCAFCHNPELIGFNSKQEYGEEEILDLLSARRKYLDGVCITGGEPLINEDILEFLNKIKKLGYKIKIDTNGSNPNLLKKILSENLVDYVAMDIKTSPSLYSKVCGVTLNMKNIEESMKILADEKQNNNYFDFEFRTTLAPILREKEISWMTKEEIEELAKWVLEITNNKENKIFLQKFISRERGNILDENLSKEKLDKSMTETPEKVIRETQEIMLKYLKNIKTR